MEFSPEKCWIQCCHKWVCLSLLGSEICNFHQRWEWHIIKELSNFLKNICEKLRHLNSIELEQILIFLQKSYLRYECYIFFHNYNSMIFYKIKKNTVFIKIVYQWVLSCGPWRPWLQQSACKNLQSWLHIPRSWA